ncbi:hypothetical protein AwDysgo_04000 [Bacteroidales bacterium]|nr:hypothetical protein AwDysgo_04000 [Bacteroidales bacterium]
MLQDQDSSDCKVLKQKLINLCDSNRDCRILVRIVCRELESWYIGDFEAIGAAYPQFDPSKYKDKARFKNPETCHASAVLKKILPGFQKVASAKKIAPFLNPETNRSQSFKQTILGIKNFFDAVEPHL